jgi:predicted metal-dependent hydrolase
MAAWRNKRMHVVLKTAQGPFPVPVRFTRRRGIRHLKVSIDLYNEVVVNVPPFLAEAKAHHFLQEQADWIYGVLHQSPETISLADYLAHRPTLSGFGRAWTASISLSNRNRCLIDPGLQRVRLFHRPHADLNLQLLVALRDFALQVIPERVAQLARSVDLGYQRVCVRDQRSRWGSCSERGCLSFNWRLVLLPPPLHDYLIWHELAHLRHLNHSPRYWRLLSTFDPDYEAHDAGITEWSTLLMRLGRTGPRRIADLIEIDV